MIRADAELNASGFLAGLKSIDSGILGLTGGFGKLTAAFAGFAALFATVSKLKSGLDLGGEFSDLHDQTGQSIEDLVLLKQAFANANAGEVGPVLAKFDKILQGVNDSGGSAAEALSKLGVSGKDLANESAINQITALSAGFQGLTNDTERSAVAQELFGKSGAKMLAIFSDSSALSVAKTQVGGLGALLQQNAPAFDALSDALGALHLKFEQLSVGALSAFAPEMQGVATALNQVDFTELGKGLGEAAKSLGEALPSITTVASAIETVGKVAVFTGHIFEGWGLLIKDVVGQLKLLATVLEVISGVSIFPKTTAQAAKPVTPVSSSTATQISAQNGPLKQASRVSSLQRIGGGDYGPLGGGAGDALLSNARAQTRQLEIIAKNTALPPRPPAPNLRALPDV